MEILLFQQSKSTAAKYGFSRIDPSVKLTTSTLFFRKKMHPLILLCFLLTGGLKRKKKFGEFLSRCIPRVIVRSLLRIIDDKDRTLST